MIWFECFQLFVHLTPCANAKSNLYMPLLEPMLFQTRSTHPKTNRKYHALRNVLEVMGEFSHFQPTANPLTVKSSNLWQTCPPEPWHCWRKRAAVESNKKKKIGGGQLRMKLVSLKFSSLGLSSYSDSATQTQSTDKAQTKSNMSSARYTFSYRHVSQWSKNSGVQHDPTLHPLPYWFYYIWSTL